MAKRSTILATLLAIVMAVVVGSGAYAEMPDGRVAMADGAGEPDTSSEESRRLNDVDDDLILIEDEEDEEPAMWPVYLSFGALGMMVLLVIIVNATSRKSKK